MRSSLLVASFVLGALATPRSVFTDVLTKRQSGNAPSFPSQCSSQCQNIENALTQCSDDSCFCTSTNIQAFAACLQCTVNLAGDVQSFQSDLNQVIQDCDTEGFNVPNETLTGGGSGGSVPTGGSSPSNSFSSPAQSTGGGGNNPFGGSSPTTTTTQPTTTSGSGSGGNLPNIGGNSRGGGALANGVSSSLVTIIGGICLAIAAL